VTISPRWEKEICVSYRRLELANSVDEIRHDLVRKAIKRYGLPTSHLEFHIIASLPGNGTGLGSSSALSVALVKACYAFLGSQPTSFYGDWRDIALEAFRLERGEDGPRVGFQDHLAAACGGFNAFSVTTDRSGIWRIAYSILDDDDQLEELTSRLLLFEIGGRKQDSDNIMQSIVTDFAHDNEAKVRAADALTSQAQTMVEEIANRNWLAVGELLDKGWQEKQKLSAGVTSPRIDEIYAAAREHGATGGKVCGKGGGGFLLLYCDHEYKVDLRYLMAELGCRELAFDIAPRMD
jgi:D-glycero-alpha-D-manno-heptose-7-phosphate kinase